MHRRIFGVCIVVILGIAPLSAINMNELLQTVGQNSSDSYGYSVASAGDVNGDGYNDIIVGAYKYDGTAGTDAGAAYIFFGGNPMDATPDVILEGENASDFFGLSVSTAGDVNGDGYDDVIVGALGYDGPGGSSSGAAYIFFGGPSMDANYDVKMVGENANDLFGVSVSTAGDLNGDGYDDVIVGAYLYDTPGIFSNGAAYIFFGSATMNPTPSYDLKLTGESGGDNFGIFVNTAGDVNGDLFDDVIVGAYRYDGTAGTDAGAAYIFYGGNPMDASYDVKMEGENSYDRFGTSVSTAGDVNNDGYSDVIVGAYQYDNGAYSNAGAAYIFFGGNPMDANYDVKMVGENASDYFGYSVASAGDIDADGFSDVIVGAYGYSSSTGAAYIFLGSSSMNPTPTYDVRLVGQNSSDYFGFSVSPAGDVNNDGYSEVNVGAYRYDNGSNTDAGSAYIFTVDQATLINELNNQGISQISINPNPGKGILWITVPEYMIGKRYEIYNRVGEKITHGEITSGKMVLNLKSLTSGVYIFRVSSTTLKFVKD